MLPVYQLPHLTKLSVRVLIASYYRETKAWGGICSVCLINSVDLFVPESPKDFFHFHNKIIVASDSIV